MKGRIITTVLAIAMMSLPLWAQDAKKAGGEEISAKTKVIKAGSEPKYKLEQKYLPGKYLMKMTAKSKVSQGKLGSEDAGQMMPGMETEIIMEMLLTVGDYNDEGIKELTIEYQSFDMKMPMMQMSMTKADAEAQAAKEAATSQPAGPGDPQKMMTDVYRNLLLTKIIAEMDRNDKVVSVKGMDKVFDSMKSNPMMAAMAAQMKKSFSDKMVKDSINVGQENLPNIPVGVGGEWVNRMSLPIPMMGKMNTDTTMVLSSVKNTPAGKVATIETTMTVDKGKDDTANAHPMFNMKSMKSNMTGTMEFNIDMGMTASYTQEGTMDMEMDAGNQGGIKISQELMTTTTIKKIK